MNIQIQQDKVNSNVYRAKVGDYELQVRIEFPLKGVVITTIEDVLEGNIPGTYGLLTPHHVADGETVFAVTKLQRNDTIVASATVFPLSRDSWSKFAQFSKCQNLESRFVEIAHEIVELWLVKVWDDAWGSRLASLLARVSEVPRLDDAIDRLNGVIATIEGTKRLVPVIVKARGDSDELGEQSFRLFTAHRFISGVASKQIGSMSEIRQITKKLENILGIKR